MTFNVPILFVTFMDIHMYQPQTGRQPLDYTLFETSILCARNHIRLCTPPNL